MNKLSDFLTKKYLDWQAKLGERKTLEDFADHLGVSRPLLSFWMNGKRIPNDQNLENLSLKLGNEIYDALELPRPNPYQQIVNRVWEFIPEDVQKRFAEEAERYETQNISERISKAPKRRKTSKPE